MKILYHHRTRAADAQGVHIAEMVQAFRDLGHTVELAALVSPDSRPPDRTVREPLWRRLVRAVPFSFEILLLSYNLAGLWLLLRAVLRFRPHFIYERYALFNFAGVLVARLFRIPLVLEVNSPLALEAAEEGLLRLRRLARWSEARICNAASLVVAVTGVLRSMLIEGGADGRRVRVLHNGVSRERFYPKPPDPSLRSALGLEGCFVIGFVGWFRPWHGLELLLEAFRRAGFTARPARLLLVGDGPAMPSLRQKVESMGLSGSVIFTGAVPHREIPAYVSLFDCAVQPAANPYCCPMKIIEYLAMAKPVVAPAQPNISELVDHGVEACLFHPGDADSLASALVALAEQPGLLDALRRGAASAIERKGLLWPRNAEAVIAWLRESSVILVRD